MFFGAESLCFRSCSDAWRSLRVLGTAEAPEALGQRWMPQQSSAALPSAVITEGLLKAFFFFFFFQ